MKKLFTLLTMLIIGICGMWGQTSTATCYVVNGRTSASDLKAGKKYMIWHSGVQQFIGVLGSDYAKLSCTITSAYSTMNANYIWELQTGTENGTFKIKNVGTSLYCAGCGNGNYNNDKNGGNVLDNAGKDYTIGDFAYCPDKGNGLPSYADGGTKAYDSGNPISNISPTDNTVYIVQYGTTGYWNWVNNAFNTFKKSHVYVLYEVKEVEVPSGCNSYIGETKTISSEEWKEQSNWGCLDHVAQWNINGPGCANSNMWSPIYLKDITGGTVPTLEGWNLRMIADHSKYTIESLGKIQGGQDAYITLKNNSVVTMNFGSGHTYPLTVNLGEGDNNILNFNMSNGYKHSNCAESKCTGQIIVNYGSVSKNTGRVFNASGSGSINQLILNATLMEPTENNTVVEIPLVTYTSGVSSATVTCNISGTDEWTEASSLENLKARTSDGKYYYVEKSPSTGVILYTYKLNAPVEVNSGAITVDAEITSGVVSLINTAIETNDATSVDLTGTTTTEITGLEIPANCLVIVNDGTTVKDGNDEDIENNVVVKDGEDYSCENLVLTDKFPFKAPVEFTATSITHERTTSSTSAVWGTACLPYPVQSVSGEGDGIRYYQLSESNSNDGVMSFTLITEEIAANTPVVFIKSSRAEFNFNSTDKSVAITPANPESSEIQGMTLVGTFAGSDDVATDDSKNYYYISGNKFWRATGTLKVSPFRAYFTSSKGVQSARNFTLQVVDNGTITRIDSVDGIDVSNVSDEHVYTLEGKKVNNVKKGSIYIIGGNKVVIK